MAAPAVDISSMPVPPDISGMPTPPDDDDIPPDIAAEAGAAENVLSLGTGALGAAAGGAAYLGKSATNAVGLTHGDPLETARSVSGAMTYQPRTDAGKGVQGV